MLLLLLLVLFSLPLLLISLSLSIVIIILIIIIIIMSIVIVIILSLSLPLSLFLIRKSISGTDATGEVFVHTLSDIHRSPAHTHALLSAGVFYADKLSSRPLLQTNRANFY